MTPEDMKIFAVGLAAENERQRQYIPKLLEAHRLIESVSNDTAEAREAAIRSPLPNAAAGAAAFGNALSVSMAELAHAVQSLTLAVRLTDNMVERMKGER